ncbi:hypothetical protein CKC_01250 [Candidatus Liberibacter solanacearum CLso-ZC1]|uniref:Uncharacterized protein n=1 Tax=Liberibacter solanacearum (strain CLso-ZC1) TaxID=658172 RepID=E4UCB1_LIBSC|nr:hypothetical protein [Candidatus Liberibacter solanacearum]ADR52001.1 hypothetical protein CKC_01250 [Candidatus Liberibacter solanacearum CLso-ZC1]
MVQEKPINPNKGRISIRDTARIAKENNIRIEIERDGTIYRFEPLSKRKNPPAEEDNSNPLGLPKRNV